MEQNTNLNENQKSPMPASQDGATIESPKNNENLIKIILLVILVVLLGYFGSHLYQKYNEKSVPQTEVEVPVKTSTENDMDASMSNWKTYTNEEYGFEFKYPEEWSMLNQIPPNLMYTGFPLDGYANSLKRFQESKMFVGTCEGFFLQNTKIPTTVIAMDIPFGSDGSWCWSSGDFSKLDTPRSVRIGNTSQEDIDRIKWYIGSYVDPSTNQIVEPDWKGDIFQTYYFENKYPISLLYVEGTDATAEKTFDQILSTFKFTESAHIQVAKSYLDAYVSGDWVTAKSLNSDSTFDENVAAGYKISSYNIIGSSYDPANNQYTVLVTLIDKDGNIYNKSILMARDSQGNWKTLTWYFFE